MHTHVILRSIVYLYYIVINHYNFLACSYLSPLIIDFAEVPTPVIINVSENQNVLFRCRHERQDALYNWLINGTPSSRYSDVSAGSISESDGTFVYTLTIPTIPVYNGTEVVCVATFFDGPPSERTPPVMLFIGLLLHTISKLRLLVYILFINLKINDKRIANFKPPTN